MNGKETGLPEKHHGHGSGTDYEDFWYRLDNVGKIFAPIASRNLTTVFRLSVILRERVHVGALQAAISNVSSRFPYFRVGLRKGFFWYFLEHTRTNPELMAENSSPCEEMAIGRKDTGLIRLKAFKTRISAEFSHTLTDGAGGLEYIRSLAAEYLRLIHGPFEDWDGLMRPGQIPDPEESEDAFLRHYNPHAPMPHDPERAFHLPYRNRDHRFYGIITGKIPLAPLSALAKEKKVSVNDYLVALVLEAFQEEYFRVYPKDPPHSAPPIRAVVPINLRRLFPSKTMRNFILFTSPEIDPRLGKYTFEEILSTVHHHVRLYSNAKAVQPAMGRNVRGERNAFVRVVPRVIKDLYLNYKHYRAGDRLASFSVSNLGMVKMPESFSHFIEGFDFVPPPDPATKCNCGIIGFGNTVVITFGRTIAETSVERFFFRRLVKLGIPVKIESN